MEKIYSIHIPQLKLWRLWLLVVIVTMEIWMFNIHKYYYKALHGLNSKGLKVAVDFAYAVHALCDK